MSAPAMHKRNSLLFLSMALLGGCSENIVQAVASPELCRAWYELQVCPQDRVTDQTAKRIIGLNVGRRELKCQPPPKDQRPDCPQPAKVADATPAKPEAKP